MTSMATSVLCRSFGTATRLCAKPGYFLHKLLDREPIYAEKRKVWESQGPQIAHSVPCNNTRRQSVLNALYMDTITDILSSEFSTELGKFSIQIHNVRIVKSLQVINVYWSCDESGIINPEAAEVLKTLEPKIRKEISAVRHMGVIPRVNFVFYTGSAEGNAVHTLLNRLRAAGELDDVEPAPVPIKEYPQVFGLDRNKILRIVQSRSLPVDLLQPEGKNTARDGNQKPEASESFMQQFQRSKIAEKKLKKNSRQDPLFEYETVRLLLEEQRGKNQSFGEDGVDDQDEEMYFDDDVYPDELREDEYDSLHHEDERS